MARPDDLTGLVAELRSAARPGLTVMEVCGTHTMAIARFGLRQLLPEGVRLVSGPGCPVCVTAMADLDRVLAVADLPGVTLVTFGDLVRVPASRGSLAAARLEARAAGLTNFSLLSLHKTMPLPLRALLDLGETSLGGFLLPGHVSVITGTVCYEFLAADYGIGGVVAGFEARDVLEALLMLARQERPAVEIQYTRAVRPEGNSVARRLLEQVFEPSDADWRGLGVIPGSGLALREEFADVDAARRFPVDPGPALEPAGCRCGEVLRGVTDPADCALFGARCTPEDPVGACMVSSEGACAAAWRYRGIGNG